MPIILNKIVTRLPPIKIRSLQLGQQRSIISPKKWRNKKANVQAVAGRSFALLSRKILAEINKLLFNRANYGEDMVFISQIDKKIKEAYSKAYMLGLKSSGVTLYQHNLSFKKVSLPTLETKEAYWLNQTIFEKLEHLRDIVNNGVDIVANEIEKDMLQFYQQGRIVGAPIYSFIYFNCDSGHPECQKLMDMSPWPKELIDNINPCCRFRIVLKTALEYRARLLEF